jgi:TPR repeat protein
MCESKHTGCKAAALAYLDAGRGTVDMKRAAALASRGCLDSHECGDAVQVAEKLPDDLADPVRKVACDKNYLDGCMARTFVKHGELLAPRDPARLTAFLSTVCVDSASCQNALDFLRQNPLADAKVERDIFLAACQHQAESGACLDAALLVRSEAASSADAVRAAGLLESACAEGVISACVDQATMLQDGELPADPARASSILAKACAEDVKNPTDLWDEACPAHAAILDRTDPAAATAELRRACAAGRAQSCVLLATRLAGGVGTPKDPDRAWSITARACENGAPAACGKIFDDIADKLVPDGGMDRAIDFLTERCHDYDALVCGLGAVWKRPERAKIVAALNVRCTEGQQNAANDAACTIAQSFDQKVETGRCLSGDLESCREVDQLEAACRADPATCARAADEETAHSHRLEALGWARAGCSLGDAAACKRLGSKR